MTRRLAREEGLLVGGSCGMAVEVALRVAAKAGADALVVVLLPDGGRGYLSKIFNDTWMSAHGFLDGEEGPRVGDVLRAASVDRAAIPHVRPEHAVAEALTVLREAGLTRVPLVRAQPPVMAAEVAGSVDERHLLGLLASGAAKPGDPVERHASPGLETIGSGEPVSDAAERLRSADVLLVLDGGKPAGLLTRGMILDFLSG